MDNISNKGIIPGKLSSSILSLFASSTTLICCALPALFVSIGAGAVLVGLISAFPQLIWISKHKLYFFAGAGIMLIIAGIAEIKGRREACPTDPQLARACGKTRIWSWRVYLGSVFIYFTGVFFAFILPAIKRMI